MGERMLVDMTTLVKYDNPVLVTKNEVVEDDKVIYLFIVST